MQQQVRFSMKFVLWTSEMLLCSIKYASHMKCAAAHRQISFHAAAHRSILYRYAIFYLTVIVMSENKLVDLSMAFAVDIVNLCNILKGNSSLTNQLLRSGTSIGANIHEANYAHSKADFIAKLQISLKECYESEYWLELFYKTQLITQPQYLD